MNLYQHRMHIAKFASLYAVRVVVDLILFFCSYLIELPKSRKTIFKILGFTMTIHCSRVTIAINRKKTSQK